MATTATTLVQRTRRFLGDWPENDACTASMSNSVTTLTVADSTLYSPGFIVQLDIEAMYVSATPSPTTVTVRRGVRGTTAVTHPTATTVLLRPHFLDVEYLDALNSGIGASFPLLYQSVVDESLTAVTSTYEYTVPNLNTVPIPYLSRIQFKENSDLAFRDIRAWTVLRGSTPKIKFRRDLPPGTIRIYGFGPLPVLTDLTSSLSTLYPTNAEDALTLYASQYLLASGEARRVREDTGARDDRENANRVGGSMAASQSILQRFQIRLTQVAMPPMPKNIVSVI